MFLCCECVVVFGAVAGRDVSCGRRHGGELDRLFSAVWCGMMGGEDSRVVFCGAARVETVGGGDYIIRNDY